MLLAEPFPGLCLMLFSRGYTLKVSKTNWGPLSLVISSGKPRQANIFSRQRINVSAVVHLRISTPGHLEHALTNTSKVSPQWEMYCKNVCGSISMAQKAWLSCEEVLGPFLVLVPGMGYTSLQGSLCHGRFLATTLLFWGVVLSWLYPFVLFVAILRVLSQSTCGTTILVFYICFIYHLPLVQGCRVFHWEGWNCWYVEHSFHLKVRHLVFSFGCSEEWLGVTVRGKYVLLEGFLVCWRILVASYSIQIEGTESSCLHAFILLSDYLTYIHMWLYILL